MDVNIKHGKKQGGREQREKTAKEARGGALVSTTIKNPNSSTQEKEERYSETKTWPMGRV